MSIAIAVATKEINMHLASTEMMKILREKHIEMNHALSLNIRNYPPEVTEFYFSNKVKEMMMVNHQKI